MLKKTSLYVLFAIIILSLAIFAGCSDDDDDDNGDTPIEGELLINYVMLDEPYVKDFSNMNPVELDGEVVIPLVDFISIQELNDHLEDPVDAAINDYRYRIYGDDGFYAYMKRYSRGAQDNSWEHLQHAYVRPGDNQILFDYTEEEENQVGIVGAHKVKNAAKIRFMRERFSICDTAGTEIGEFYFSDHDTTLNATFQDTLDAYQLTDIVGNSGWDGTYADYGYRLVGADGWDGFKVYSWERLEQGYWIWEDQKTDFAVESSGKNKIKDLAKIQLRPASEINEDVQ